jgi:hypothetical protein
MTVRQGDFTVLTNKNVGSKIEIPSVSGLPTIEGKSQMLMILFIPTGKQPVIEDALDDALDKGQGNLMVDAVVENYMQYYVLAAVTGVRVKGKVVALEK